MTVTVQFHLAVVVYTRSQSFAELQSHYLTDQLGDN